MIVEEIKQHSIDGENPSFKKQYLVTIDAINEWKFIVWIDLMNAYDDFEKSRHDVSKFRNQIIDDYKKDFKDDEVKPWEKN